MSDIIIAIDISQLTQPIHVLNGLSALYIYIAVSWNIIIYI